MASGKGVICGSKMLRVLMIVLALGLSVYTIAPAVYWHVVAEDGDVLTKWVLQCPPCPLECKSTLAESASRLLIISQKLNSTLPDCVAGNRDMKEEVGKTLAQLLREGLKLQKEAKSAEQRADRIMDYLDASKKTVYQNLKGRAEKGTKGLEAMDKTRERAEVELAKETTRANLWEKRARDLGWKPKPVSSQKYKKYIQMLDG